MKGSEIDAKDINGSRQNLKPEDDENQNDMDNIQTAKKFTRGGKTKASNQNGETIR